MKRINSFAVVICAAGSSRRMNGVKKEYCLLPGTNTTVLARAVLAFAAFSGISRIIITIPPKTPDAEAQCRRSLPSELVAGKLPQINFIPGGGSRRESVHNALSALSRDPPDYVLIHDGSRPWVSGQLIRRVMEAVQQHKAVIPLLPLTDTPKEVDVPFSADFSDKHGLPEGVLPVVTRHVHRNFMGAAQTPQAFAFQEILAAHGKAAEKERAGLHVYTDDAEVWGEFCGPVSVVPGEAENRKITFYRDLDA